MKHLNVGTLVGTSDGCLRYFAGNAQESWEAMCRTLTCVIREYKEQEK